MTQAYGYNEVGKGVKDIKHFENDYDRNKIGASSSHAADLFSRSHVLQIHANYAARSPISSEMGS
jgi:hypothetical protein